MLLGEALLYYQARHMDGDFENANMYLYSYDRKKKQWGGRMQELPFTKMCIRDRGSHSMEDVARYADRLIVMNHGQKVYDLSLIHI